MPKGIKGFQKGHKTNLGKHWKMPESFSKKLSERNKRLGTLPPSQKGVKRSLSTRKKIGDGQRGEKSRFYIDGRSRGKNEREYYKNKCIERRFRVNGVGGVHTVGEWETLKAQYNYTCLRCKKSEPEIKLSEDHIIPLVKGGSNNIENIQPLCRSCNSIKHTDIIDYK